MRVKPIEFDTRLHELGEQVELAYPIKRALAWWIAAEIIRRHPDEIRVVETHPGGGLYDCVSLFRRDANDSAAADMNLEGHITHASWFGNPGGDRAAGIADARFNWLEVLASEDRRSYVIEALEGACGLKSPKKSPPTTSRSIGPRLLARFAGAAAFTTRTWHICNAVYDSSGMWSGVNKWVHDIKGPEFESQKGDLLREPYYRYWFVLDHERKPVSVTDVDLGFAWRRDRPNMTYNLMELYVAYDSHIDRVMAEVLPAVE